MPEIQIKEPDLLGLLNQMKSRAERGETITRENKQAVADDIIAKAAASRRQRAGFEFDVSESSIDTMDTSSPHAGLKQFIHHTTTERAPIGQDADVVKSFQDYNDALLLQSAVTKRPVTSLPDFQRYKSLGNWLAKSQSKAWASGTGLNDGSAGFGLEFIPTNFSAQLIQKFRLELMVANLFRRIQMPTATYKLPLEFTDSTASYIGEVTTDTNIYDPTYQGTPPEGAIPASQPKTANITLTARKMALRTVWSDEIQQDSIINIVEYARDKIAKAMANAVENADLNGDRTATHQDFDTNGSTNNGYRVERAWYGLRQIGLSNAGSKKDFTGTLSVANLRALRKQLGKFAARPSQLAWIVGPQTYIAMMSFPEVITMDKYGPNATIVTGELARLDGIPVVVSEFTREGQLAATGVNTTGGPNTFSALFLVNTQQFIHGDRSLLTIQSFDAPITDQHVALIKQRLDFESIEYNASSSLFTVGVGYDFTP